MRKYGIIVAFFALLGLSVFASQTDTEPVSSNEFSLAWGSNWFSSGDRLRDLNLMRRTFAQVKKSYLDPERIHPKDMARKALEAISERIAEVRITEKTPQTWVLYVDDKSKELQGPPNSLNGVRSVLSDAMQFIRSHKVSEISDEDMEVVAINGALSTLDPHTLFLSRDVFNEWRVGTSGKFGGLGIMIGIRESKLTIIAPLEDTPAFRAGLKSGDVITKIGDESTVNMNLEEAVKRMRGPRGVPITIAVIRTGWEKERDFTLVRDIINIVSVESSLLPNKVGYVRIKNFQENTIRDLGTHLRKVHALAESNLKGLILDVRGNPGGFLNQAVDVADKFLADGPIVTTVGMSGRVREVEKASSAGTEPKYSMVVLVDGGSASASEIVAGALQKTDRALLLGQRTFGKATVQSLIEMPENTALKITIAQYLTPGDFSIQSVGITPDIELAPSVFSKDRVTLFQPTDFYREESLEHHFQYLKDKKEEPVESVAVRFFQEIKSDVEPGQDRSTLNDDEKVKAHLEDFWIRSAHELLSAAPPLSNRTKLIESSKSLIEEWNQRENRKITKALKARGVDWSTSATKNPVNCTDPKASVVTHPSSGHPVSAGQKLRFDVTVSNPGNCTLDQLWARLSTKNYLFHQREFHFGKVLPGARVTRNVEVEIPKSAPSSLSKIDVEFEAKGKIAPPTMTTTVAIAALPKPKFAFRYEISDRSGKETKGNGNGILEDGETVEMKVFIENVGAASAEDAVAALRNKGGSEIFLRRGRFPFSKLTKGASVTASFLFDVKKNGSQPASNLDFSIFDNTYRVYTSKEIKLPWSPNPDLASAEPMTLLKAPEIQTNAENLALQFVNQSEAKIEGKVSDDEGPKDVFILVNGHKVFYQSFGESSRKGKEHSFSATIPMDPGVNRVLLVARDGENMVEHKAFSVYRLSSQEAVTKTSEDPTMGQGYSMDDFFLDLPSDP